MSTTLAIGAVTASLQYLIHNRLARPDFSTVIPSVTVSVIPPDRIVLPSANDPNQVNIFLHRLSKNSAMSNLDLPSRDSMGRRLTSPRLVIDLHYIISVYGAMPYYAEILAGEVIQVFHENAIIPRSEIRKAIDPQNPPAGFPEALKLSGLADQIEQIKVVQDPINIEEMGKLWSSIQAKYRTTITYLVTTVIIEEDKMAKSSLPVGHPTISGVPFQAPVINSIHGEGGPFQPVTIDSPIVIEGSRLFHEHMEVLFNEIDVSQSITDSSAEVIKINLPSPAPTGIYAGVFSVRIVHKQLLGDPETLHRGVSSNTEVTMLRPVITGLNVTVDSTDSSGPLTLATGSITFTLNPGVGRMQRVAFLLNEYNPPASQQGRSYSFASPVGNGLDPSVPDTDTIEIPFVRVVQGEYLVRIRVDGAESLLAVHTSTGIFHQPRVTI